MRPTPYSNELYHHGVKGQRWGVRRYRNEDGSLTEAGKKREAKRAAKLESYKERERARADKYYTRRLAKAERAVEKTTSRLQAAEKEGTTTDKKLSRLASDAVEAQVQRNVIKGERAVEMRKIKNMSVEDMRKEKAATATGIAAASGIAAANAALVASGQVPVFLTMAPVIPSLMPQAVKSSMRISDEAPKTLKKAIHKTRTALAYHDNGAQFAQHMMRHHEAVRLLNDQAQQAHFEAVGNANAMHMQNLLQTHLNTMSWQHFDTMSAQNHAMELHNQAMDAHAFGTPSFM